MTQSVVIESDQIKHLEVPNRASDASRRFVRTSPIGALAAAFLTFLFLVAIFADQVAPYHPLEADFRALRQAPSFSIG